MESPTAPSSEPGSEPSGEPGNGPGNGPVICDLALVPGLRVATRVAGQLVVVGGGRDDVTLRDTPAVRLLLDTLARRQPLFAADLDDASTHQAVDRLVAAGLTEASTEAAARAHTRAAVRVLVDAGDQHAGTAIGLLLAAGVAVTTRRERATHALVMGSGAVDRARVAHWNRRGVVHLVVTDHGQAVTVGPLVHPGRTSCLHCLDAHHGQRDPEHPALVAQLVGTNPLTAVSDPALQAISIGWAVRDLVSVVDGDRPSTWSATVTLAVDRDAGLQVTRHEWRRHPDCGCAWGDVIRPEQTG